MFSAYNDSVTEMHVRSCFRPSRVTVLCTLLIISISELFNDAVITSEVIESVLGVKVCILGDDGIGHCEGKKS